MNTPHTITVDDLRDYIARTIFASANGRNMQKQLIIETSAITLACEYVVTQGKAEVYRGRNISRAVETYNSLP